jgi:hypothetical protein
MILMITMMRTAFAVALLPGFASGSFIPGPAKQDVRDSHYQGEAPQRRLHRGRRIDYGAIQDQLRHARDLWNAQGG